MATISIIDDDVELAENLSMVLQNEGHRVVIRDTVENALAFIEKEKPDLVILDVMFPENPAGGFDLAREIKNSETTKSIPVILLTAINQELPMDFSGSDIDPEWMPVHDFVEKPLDISVMLEKVKALLGTQE